MKDPELDREIREAIDRNIEETRDAVLDAWHEGNIVSWWLLSSALLGLRIARRILL